MGRNWHYVFGLSVRLCVCWSGGIPDRLTIGFYTVLQKNIAYHPTSTDNFNSSSRIPVIFGTVITE